jgi:copper(I)-binding protein
MDMKVLIQLFTGMLLTVILCIASADEVMTVVDPYVRTVPPGQKNTAAFMLLENQGIADVALQQATSTIAETVELHEHVKNGDMMVMRQVKKIDIAAGSATALQPGGYHVMLIGLREAIMPGDIIDINLEFSDGTAQAIKAEVRKIDIKKMVMKKEMTNGG